jgi:diguanylate cyclase (GGDEF)-like protein
MKSGKSKILIVDDVEVNLEFIKVLLQSEYEIVTTTNPELAIQIAKAEKPDLILLDVIMPQITGFEACRILKQDNETKDIPIIFLTSQTDESSIATGYGCGAIDYITKPYKPVELKEKIKIHLKIQNLIYNLEYVATHDTMTDIYNRGHFFKLAKKKFLENKDNLYVVMIDIDDFKHINDTYGHDIGDKVIKEFASIVKSMIKKDTIFGRIGGEEFALMCEYDDEKELQKHIEEIRKTIENRFVFSSCEEKKISFTVSIGIAKVSNKHIKIDDVLKDADKNLYHAKDTGKNRVVYRER